MAPRKSKKTEESKQTESKDVVDTPTEQVDGGGKDVVDTPVKQVGGKKERKSTKKKRPEGKPKKPSTSFIEYSKSNRSKVLEEMKDSDAKNKNTAVTKKLAEKWNSMTAKQKKPYVDTAAKANKVYKKELEVWKEKTAVPKKASSNFFMFTGEKRKEYLEKVSKDLTPQKKNTEVSKLLGAAWKQLSDEEKQPYTKMALADKERYAREMVAYREKQNADVSVDEA
jgi:hypothetical protein